MHLYEGASGTSSLGLQAAPASMTNIKEACAGEPQKAIHRYKIWGFKRPRKEARLLDD